LTSQLLLEHCSKSTLPSLLAVHSLASSGGLNHHSAFELAYLLMQHMEW